MIISGPEVGVGGGVLIDSPRLLLSESVSEPESSSIPLLLQSLTWYICMMSIILHAEKLDGMLFFWY